MSDPAKAWLSVAETLALQAADAVLGFLDTPLATRTKADASPVTEADLASDRILREGLAKHFPQHAILSEENGLSGDVHSEYVWIIDPLDGTKAFAKGQVGFCVMVGLLKAGEPYLGVVVDPLESRTYRAVRGQGAGGTWQGRTRELRVSSRRDFSQMPLIVSTGFPSQALAQIQNFCRGPLLSPINSVGIKVGFLLRQEADIYVNHHSVSYWDTCAPQLILEEAGGLFTALDGSPLRYAMQAPFTHGVKTLASNGLRHGDLVEKLRGTALVSGF